MLPRGIGMCSKAPYLLCFLLYSRIFSYRVPHLPFPVRACAEISARTAFSPNVCVATCTLPNFSQR